MSNQFPKVWYASSDKVSNLLKLSFFDDRGHLCVGHNAIEFIGKKETLSIRSIVKVSFVSQWGPKVAVFWFAFVILVQFRYLFQEQSPIYQLNYVTLACYTQHSCSG